MANCMRKILNSTAQESARTPANTFQLSSVGRFHIGFSSFVRVRVYILSIFTFIICKRSRLADMGEDGAGCSDDYDPADPKVDPRERRRIRYEYRELIAETQSK